MILGKNSKIFEFQASVQQDSFKSHLLYSLFLGEIVGKLQEGSGFRSVIGTLNL
jgi:hypothetical protein